MSRSFRTSVGLCVATAAIVLTPLAAFAHTRLTGSTPAANAKLAVVPREIRLDFSEAPSLAVTSVQLIDPAGHALSLSPLAYAGKSRQTVVAPVPGSLQPGEYTVVWKTAADDGHVARGTFRFVILPEAVGAGSAATARDIPAVAGTSAAPLTTPREVAADSMAVGTQFGAGSLPYVIIRWALFAGLLVVIGAVAFRQFVLRFLRRAEDPDSPALDDAARRTARLALVATGALVIVELLRLLAQSSSLTGAGTHLGVALVATVATKTLWGYGWIAQMIGVVVAGLGFYLARNAPPQSTRTRHGWAIATCGAILLAFTPALGGHAASAPRLLPLSIIADGLHVAGASGWLGSLLMVLAAGIPAALSLPDAERGPMVAAFVNAYSPTALTFAGLVGATGVFAAWIHVGSIPALWQSQYGKTLLAKLAVLSVVAATGAYNWLRVKPTLGTGDSAARIRRSASIEIAVGVLVLLITAILVATPTPMDIPL